MSEVEICPECGNKDFAVARNMVGTRLCKCGYRWNPNGKRVVSAKEILNEILSETWICTRKDLDRLLDKVKQVRDLLNEK